MRKTLRSAQDIARETDAIGGQMNAFTTKECTCFYGRVLDSHLPQALDILFDMVYHSSFAQEAVETERGVILEEIDMYNMLVRRGGSGKCFMWQGKNAAAVRKCKMLMMVK